MRGRSAEEVAERVLSQTSLSGLQGPTISPVFWKRDGKVAVDYYAIVICVPKKVLYKSVQQLRAVRICSCYYIRVPARAAAAIARILAGLDCLHIRGKIYPQA